ncbi:hypothetical protein [Paraburkholderia sp. BCC1886]|uniref:hypothetical protein n=1 Tax=Paraburkholderia sp. BCC1886 TaxID=2562670 RepID=UPI001183C2CB|nr:hypothetical protein [Paraburkholderia sp. BCC1886]
MTTPSLFQNKSRIGAQPATILDKVVASLREETSRNAGGTFVSDSVSRAAWSLESIDPMLQQDLDSSVVNLHSALASIVKEHAPRHIAVEGQHDGAHGAKFDPVYTDAQLAAATAMAAITGDIPGYLKAPVKHDRVSVEGMQFITPQTGADRMFERVKPALEAYDEKENKNAVVYSVAYNLNAARQDEFGEAFYPTVVVTPDQVGYTVSIRLIEAYNEPKRPISGDPTKNFDRRNIVQAVIDPTILRNDQTKIIPVVRDESAKYFVSSSAVEPYAELLSDDTSVTTAPLKVGAKFSLLAISQTEALLETGLLDITDAIDTQLALAAVYVQFTQTVNDVTTTEVVKFNTKNLPLATFNYAVQDVYRQMNLQYKTDTLLVGPNTLQADGAASAILAPIVTGGYEARIGLSMFGSVNLELGNTEINASSVSLTSLKNSSDSALDTSSGTAATLAALFDGAVVIGYDLDARRTNTNRRQRGQLLNTNYYNQIYTVPLLAPITIPRPMAVGDANDSSDLAALITTTRIRTSNSAVDELLRVQDLLAETTSALNTLAAPNDPQDTPQIMGVSRFVIQPAYIEKDLAVDTQTDSLSAHQRAADIQATLVNALRDISYTLYVQSGYKAGADALAGGVAPVPTVIIGTDPYIARYLMVTGDLRTLGGQFDVKIVSTLNKRMSGKIVLSFGDFSAERAGVPNPLHFGNMAWKPEMTVVLPMIRNGAQSKELTVQPSYLHVTNLPVLGVINVTGISNIAYNKVPVDFHTV